MPDNYTKLILRHLADTRYKPRTIKQLAGDLKISADNFDLFKQSAQTLLDKNKLIKSQSATVALPPPDKKTSGTFRLHERGFGFVTPDRLSAFGDIFVPPGQTGGALTDDKVLAQVTFDSRRAKGRNGDPDRSPYTAKIIKVTERASKPYTGTLKKYKGAFVFLADGRELNEPVIIKDAESKNAKEGQKVVVELVHYPENKSQLAEGVITEILGEAGQPDVETLAVIRAFGLEEKFDPDSLQEARQAAQEFDKNLSSEAKQREDITDVFTCTIDPPDSKDYDDAITIKRLDGRRDASLAGSPDGAPAAYELGVHIADVSHFVLPGSALDKQAFDRGNSTYLPRFVVPMLPEILSNGVCSLQEGVKRFCKSCFIRFDKQGVPLSSRFANTIICSDQRLTYKQAQALIDGKPKEAKKHAQTKTKPSAQLTKTLKLMDKLARIIRKRRLKEGMIVLGLPEVDLIFDDQGKVIDAQPEDDSFTHTLIEMFMVEANEAAARTFDELDVPMIRRVHADPSSHDTGNLKHFARIAGYNIPSNPDRKQLQELLDTVRGKPAEHAVSLAVLKTLSKAEYSPLVIGHFALASEHYTHFTSPIRRYPDLVVHRALSALIEYQNVAKKENSKNKQRKQKLSRQMGKDPRVPNENQLVEIGEHCSGAERNSEAAERNLRSYLVLQLLSEKLGEDFQGTVTGVTKTGVFVELDKFCTDGFVSVASLPGKKTSWKLDQRTSALVSKKSGQTIGIGARFKVRIMKVDLARRQMDLIVIE